MNVNSVQGVPSGRVLASLLFAEVLRSLKELFCAEGKKVKPFHPVCVARGFPTDLKDAVTEFFKSLF